MTHDLDPLAHLRRNPASRPLLGLTVLMVEDSRYASEAMRLLCQRSGARLRRADCLRSARRHLQSYRPAVAIVDLGLPDGPGEELIAELASARPRLPVILGTSGDPAGEGAAMAAGADGFLPKPFANLARLQSLILSGLGSFAPRIMPADEGGVNPDRLALRDDLALAADGIDADGDVIYLSRFLTGLARSAGDVPLEHAARDYGQSRDPAPITRLLRDRLDGSPPS